MTPLTVFTNFASNVLAENAMHSFIDPVIGTLCVMATIVCTFFLVLGGYQYMTSASNPESLAHAKRIIRNALIGLVIVLSAAALTTILNHAYGSTSGSVSATMPKMASIQPQKTSSGLVDVLIKAITGLLQNIIESIAAPFMKALGTFTSGTPLTAANSSVFALWLAVVGIADALFVLVVALLGFHVMSFAAFGLEEIEFKHLLPKLGLVFVLFNTSIFAIDGVISLSNGMIHALNSAFPSTSVWYTLSAIAKESGGLGVAALLIMLVFLVLSIILLVYYVGRLVTLYLGAVLAPLLCLLWIIPAFKDFVETAVKVYLATIFVLFIHVVILQLASSIFTGMSQLSPAQKPDPIMSLIVGLATVIALIKTQGVLMQLSYVSTGPRTARRLGGQFVNAVAVMSVPARKMFVQNEQSSRSQTGIARDGIYSRPVTTLSNSSGLIHQSRTGMSSGANMRLRAAAFKGEMATSEPKSNGVSSKPVSARTTKTERRQK